MHNMIVGVWKGEYIYGGVWGIHGLLDREVVQKIWKVRSQVATAGDSVLRYMKSWMIRFGWRVRLVNRLIVLKHRGSELLVHTGMCGCEQGEFEGEQVMSKAANQHLCIGHCTWSLHLRLPLGLQVRFLEYTHFVQRIEPVLDHQCCGKRKLFLLCPSL